MKTLFGSKSKATLGLAALALLATSPAGAQNLTFSTTGAFGGSASCTVVQCSFGGFTLGYNGMASDTYIVPSLVDLGSFFTQASGTTLDLTSIPAGVTFTLTIMQTGPSAGTGTVGGNVSGGLAYSPSRSTLVFTPTTNTVNINGATYNLITDNSGNINIAAPTLSNNPNPTIIKANATVSTVPEPATVALMGSGLLGLVGIGGLRRRANKA